MGVSDSWETIGLMAIQINSGAVVGTIQTIRVKFVSADDELDYTLDETGRDVLTPPISSLVQETSPTSDDSLTPIGIAMVAGLTTAFLGVIFVIARKKRSRKRRVVTRSTTRNQESLPDDVKSESDTKSVTKLDVEDMGRDLDAEMLNEDDNLPESPDEFSREYNFDLGGWMKSELVGIHGESAITARPSRYADELLSDSDIDNDSWAQTEATIGSLELRLDPIEAEV